jgi:hypothetical protein
MAEEIIVNDGGAPARIIPFIADETIAAGDYVNMIGTGEVQPAQASGNVGLGVALTAATSGNIVNMVTGKGVVLKTYVSGTIAAGARLFVDSADMVLRTAGTAPTLKQAVATYVDSANTTGGAPALKKVIFG